MISNSKTIIVSVLSALSVISCTSDKPEEKPEIAPGSVAQVQTTKLQKSEISESLSVYGTVLPWPDKLQTISVPYTSRIEKLEINEGQLVQQGDVLLTLKPGDDTVLQLEQAQKELGGAIAEYQVIVNLARLNSFGLSLDDIAKALSAANVIHTVGRLEQNYKLYLVLANTQLQNPEQVSQTILRSGHNGLVFLEDVAQVVKATAPQWQRVTADGKEAVLFQIIQEGSSTVDIADNVQGQLELFQKILPAGIKIAKWYDQSDLIVASAKKFYCIDRFKPLAIEMIGALTLSVLLSLVATSTVYFVMRTLISKPT